MNEQALKAFLDGKFFSIQCGHGLEAMPVVREFDVPLNYMPRFEMSELYELETAVKPPKTSRKKRREWTEAEDNMLLEMRANGVRWKEVARALKRCSKSLIHHYMLLCQKRGIAPAKSAAPVRWRMSPELRQRIVSLRRRGKSYQAIAAEVGMTEMQVSDCYYRVCKALKRLAA